MMRSSALLAIVLGAPIVAQAIERARQRAGLSHKALAIDQGLNLAQWSQQLHGQGHISLTRLTNTPRPFRAALLEELRQEWGLGAHTVEDVYRLVRRIARAPIRRASREDPCA